MPPISCPTIPTVTQTPSSAILGSALLRAAPQSLLASPSPRRAPRATPTAAKPPCRALQSSSPTTAASLSSSPRPKTSSPLLNPPISIYSSPSLHSDHCPGAWFGLALLHEIVDAASDKCSPPRCPEVLVLYRKRERVRRTHEHGVFASPLVGIWKLHLELADDCERLTGNPYIIL